MRGRTLGSSHAESLQDTIWPPESGFSVSWEECVVEAHGQAEHERARFGA